MSVILGKDRNTEDTIGIVKNILRNAGFSLEESDLLNPIDKIWSVNLRDMDSHFYTNGKGSTKESALASAYCEFLERLGTGFFFDDYAIDGLYSNEEWIFSPDEVKIYPDKNFKNDLLSETLWDFYDPDNNLDFISFTDSGRCKDDYIIAYPFIREIDQTTVYFPLELLKNIYASNGLSAGNSEKEALIQGLSECIERGVKNYIISEAIALPDIPDSYLEKNNFLAIKNDIESYGYPVILKDASLGGRFPVICALLINNSDGSVLSSFGSHPNPLVAIERTLTELLQGRKIDALDGFSTLTYNYDQVSDESNIESHFINSSGVLHIDIMKQSDDKMVLWDFKGDRDSELEMLQKVLSDEGYDYYYRSCNIGGMWVSQSIIPKLSEIYPIEDLQVENRNRAGVIREFIKNESVCSDILNRGLNWFDESFIPGSRNIMDYIGVSADEDDPIYNIIADEVELLILIRKKSLKKVHLLLSQQMNFDCIDAVRIGFWRCLLGLLEDLSRETLDVLYGNKSLLSASNAINGIIPRNLFPVLGHDFSNVERHKEVIGVYQKYKKLMS